MSVNLGLEILMDSPTKTEIVKLYTAKEAALEIRRQPFGTKFLLNASLDMYPKENTGQYLPDGFSGYIAVTKAQANELFEKHRRFDSTPDPLEAKGWRVCLRITHEKRGHELLKDWRAVWIGAHFDREKESK